MTKKQKQSELEKEKTARLKKELEDLEAIAQIQMQNFKKLGGTTIDENTQQIQQQLENKSDIVQNQDREEVETKKSLSKPKTLAPANRIVSDQNKQKFGEVLRLPKQLPNIK